MILGRLGLHKSISDIILVGGIIGLGTCKEKVFTKESANPFVHIPMMSGNSMPHFSKVHYIPALYLLGKCYLICR